MITAERFRALWRSLAPIGRQAGEPPDGGGYLRYSWSAADLACREWFVEEALDRDLTVDIDRNGNLYAWWGVPDAAASGEAVLTGSHLDSVPDGGGYDGALGVVSALLAVDELRERGREAPPRPLGIAVFGEEEGARFGVPCLGSRLLTGAHELEAARRLRDRDGIYLAEALEAAGIDPAGLGPDPDRLAHLGAFVELHVEQGRALVDAGVPVAVGSGIWPHGRWRVEVDGEGNHAGTTAMADRHDPMVTLAALVLAAAEEADRTGGRATVGRVSLTPNATNAVPAGAAAWLDARAPDEATLDLLVASVQARTQAQARRDGTRVGWACESRSATVTFDPKLRELIRSVLHDPPVLATAAGHDAGVLAAHVPTAMLFVRNPSGVSHAPAEYATDEDCAAGVQALATVLESLVWR